MELKVRFLGAARRRTFICCRSIQISASSAARDWIRSTTIQTMSLTKSLITQQHRPILDQLLVRLGLRQGQARSARFAQRGQDWHQQASHGPHVRGHISKVALLAAGEGCDECVDFLLIRALAAGVDTRTGGITDPQYNLVRPWRVVDQHRGRIKGIEIPTLVEGP